MESKKVPSGLQQQALLHTFQAARSQKVEESEALAIAEGEKDGPKQTSGSKTGEPTKTQRLLRSPLNAVVAIGLALAVGLGTVGCASTMAQTVPTTTQTQTVDADQCRRDTAWAAALGTELGRNVDGQRGGVIGGALFALLQKTVGCQSAGEVEQSQEIKDLNKQIAEALGQDGARFGADEALPDDMKQILDYVADELASHPNAKVLVVAHADVEGNVAFTNRGLSRDRAEAVEAHLRDAGVTNEIVTEAAGEKEGKNTLELVVVEQPTPGERRQQNLFGIPGLTIEFGSGRNNQRPGNGPVVQPGQTPDATVHGSGRSQPSVRFPGPVNQQQHQGGGRTTVGPGQSGWNGN